MRRGRKGGKRRGGKGGVSMYNVMEDKTSDFLC